MMAGAFLAFVASMLLAWRGSPGWAMAAFAMALALSIGIFVGHMDTSLNLQF